MPEVCTYGGDSGTPVPGFVQFPLNDVQCCNNTMVNRGAPYGSVSTVMWSVKASFEAFGVGRLIIGWLWGLTIDGDRRLSIAEFDASVSLLGNAPSEIAVPDLVVNTNVWLRGRLSFPSGLCEYWYSYDDTLQENEVTWIDLGLPQVGVTGSPLLSNTNRTFMGNWLIGLGVFGIGASVYAASEVVDGSPTMMMQHTDVPDDSANSFALSLGGTMTVSRSASEPNTYLSPYSSLGSTYGMGHYGLCDQGPTRSCSPVKAGSIPLTQTRAFTDCVREACG